MPFQAYLITQLGAHIVNGAVDFPDGLVMTGNLTAPSLHWLNLSLSPQGTPLWFKGIHSGRSFRVFTVVTIDKHCIHSSGTFLAPLCPHGRAPPRNLPAEKPTGIGFLPNRAVPLRALRTDLRGMLRQDLWPPATRDQRDD